MKPAPRSAGPARKTRSDRGAAGGAFERGIAALTQYKERERTVVVSRSWEGELPDGTTVRLGVWLSNTRSRRAGLTQEQRTHLAEPGVDWAQ
ncbi:helicase associated domain-containing protein [Streptomyces sp. NBC_00234]|uniref:helicase associated domain-containing protein n=1 Tax=Streptomyces sp. NBC_00234 TaxID=2903638 RepID=UPI002E2983BB|nr:helicase associated domain-containing protein [Streptomyces sp. NBC_00234]